LERRIQLTVEPRSKIIFWKFSFSNFFKNDSEAWFHDHLDAPFRDDHRCSLGFFAPCSVFWQIKFVYKAAEIDYEKYFTQN
jgi:hypothetical protein